MDRELLAKVDGGFKTVGDLCAACRFHTALSEAMAKAREANVYLDRKSPWFEIKEDRAAATTGYITLRVVDYSKTILSPILAYMAQKLENTWAMRGSSQVRSVWRNTRRRGRTWA